MHTTMHISVISITQPDLLCVSGVPVICASQPTHLSTAHLPWTCLAGEEAVFHMHLGAYGQAYFAAETMEIVSGEHMWQTSCAAAVGGWHSTHNASQVHTHVWSSSVYEAF